MPTVNNVVGSAYWASYLINGDASGISEDDIALANLWCDNNLSPDEAIVGCGEPYFSWSYGIMTGDKVKGGELVEYLTLKG